MPASDTQSVIGSQPASARASSPSSSALSLSSSLPGEDSTEYKGLAAIAGNLAASLSDMLGSDSDNTSITDYLTTTATATATTSDGPQHAQQEPPAATWPIYAAAVISQPSVSASINGTNVTESDRMDIAGSGFGARQASGRSQLERHASDVAQRLQERAAAASMAASAAAVAASSTVSGITELQLQAAALPAGTAHYLAQAAATISVSGAGAAVSETASGIACPDTRAAAARAFSDAAGAPSSIVSGITELWHQPAALPAPDVLTAASDSTDLQAKQGAAMMLSEAASTASSAVSGMTELGTRAAAALALSEAAGAASSVVSGITELAAAGVAMSHPLHSMVALTANGNPFGLSSVHSVDGYSLLNIALPSSIVSNVTEIATTGVATLAASLQAPAAGPVIAATATSADVSDGQSPNVGAQVAAGAVAPQGYTDRAAAALALSDAVGAASSVVSGLTELARRPLAQQGRATRTTSSIAMSEADVASLHTLSDLTDL